MIADRLLLAVSVVAASAAACGGKPETIQEKCVAALEALEACGILHDPADKGYDEGCQQREESGVCHAEIEVLWRCLDTDATCCPSAPGSCCADQLEAYIACTQENR